MFNRIKKYDDQTSPYYAAARLWVDAIIDPVQTRKWISIGIAASDQNEDIKPYKTGVIKLKLHPTVSLVIHRFQTKN